MLLCYYTYCCTWSKKYDWRNIWLCYFDDLINPCFAFGFHKASRQILKYGDRLPWSQNGVVSGSFMCHWRAVHGLFYFRGESSSGVALVYSTSLCLQMTHLYSKRLLGDQLRQVHFFHSHIPQSFMSLCSNTF